MWKKGESGNPNGAQKEKRFYAALERAVLGDNGQKLRAAAEKLLDCAVDGEPWAIALLADRLDGKATQQIDMSVSRDIKDYSIGELVERLERLRAERAGREAAAGTALPQASALVAAELH